MNTAVSKSKVKAPAICLIAVNSISLLSGAFYLFAFMKMLLQQHRHDLMTLLLLFYCGTTVALSLISVLGGVFMLVQRHQRFCVGAVIISMVVGVLGGYLVVLNLPVAIWSLRALQRTDIAASFPTPATATPARLSMRPLRFIALGIIFLLGVAAACGYVAMIGFGIAMSGAGAGSAGYQTWTFRSLLSCSPAVSFLFVSLACLPLFSLQAIKFFAALSFLLMAPLFIAAADGLFIQLTGEALLSTGAAFFVIFTCRKRLQIERLYEQTTSA